jgi:hypothetical protein
MTEKKVLTARFMSALNDELGWDAVVDRDDEPRFDSGLGFRIWMSNYAPSDPEYLQISTAFALTQFLEQARSPLDASIMEIQVRLLKVGARLTRRLKGVKVLVLPDDDVVTFSVETVAAGPNRMPTVEHLASILPRMRAMLIAGVRDFHDESVLAGLEATISPNGPTPTINPDRPA